MPRQPTVHMSFACWCCHSELYKAALCTQVYFRSPNPMGKRCLTLNEMGSCPAYALQCNRHGLDLDQSTDKANTWPGCPSNPPASADETQTPPAFSIGAGGSSCRNIPITPIDREPVSSITRDPRAMIVLHALLRSKLVPRSKKKAKPNFPQFSVVMSVGKQWRLS